MLSSLLFFFKDSFSRTLPLDLSLPLPFHRPIVSSCAPFLQSLQIANHPFLFGEPNDEAGQPLCDARPELLVTASGKFKVLDSMLRHLHKGGHQVLVFSQMTETLNIMEDYLRFREWRYCRIDGNVKVQERQSQMDSFNNDSDIFVFMLSTRAGGLGINLQAADTVILFDSDWNPHQDAQVFRTK